MNVSEIVAEWLSNNGYTGLITEGCGCTADDLFSGCAEDASKCRPGYAGESGYVYATWELAKADEGPDSGGEESCC